MFGTDKYVKETLLDLVEARELLAAPHGWVKGAYALANLGGTAYCSIGAVRKTACGSANIDWWDLTGSKEARYARASLALGEALIVHDPKYARAHMGSDDWDKGRFARWQHAEHVVISYNDWASRTREEVLALFDLAIAMLKAEVEKIKSGWVLRVRAGLTGPGKTIVVTEEPKTVPERIDIPEQEPVEAPEPERAPAEPEKVPA